MPGRGSAKGEKRGGRKKGVPNKITMELKTMVLTALNDAGGVEYLRARAEDTPGPFLSLLGKILPTQITGEGGGPVEIVASAAQTLEQKLAKLGGMNG